MAGKDNETELLCKRTSPVYIFSQEGYPNFT